MLEQRFDSDGDMSQQTETRRGSVMGASASSSRTIAYDESPGILGVLSRRFRRSHRDKKKSHRKENSREGESDTLESQTLNGKDVAAYAHHGGGDSTHSSNEARKERGDTNKSSSDSTHIPERGAHASSSHTPSVKHKREQNAVAAVQRGAVGHGTARCRSSHSSASVHSRGTEYASPSMNGEADRNRKKNNDDHRRSRRDTTVLPPLSGPPVHALTADVQSHSVETQKDCIADAHRNKDLSSFQQSGVDYHASKNEEAGDTKRGAQAVTSSSSSYSYSASAASANATATDTTTSISDSNLGSDDDDDDDVDVDGGGRAFSKFTDQSDGPSSRTPFSGSGMHHHAFAAQANATYYAPTRDVRSSLVSTIDVDVAVVQERRRQLQHQLYLQTCMHQHVSLVAPNAPARPVHPLTSSHDNFLRQRADAVYQRHMDAVVERYLSAPKYRTALAQFRKHLSVPEQQMRTAGARERYLHATEIVVSRVWERMAAARGPRGSGGAAGDLYSGAGAAGHEGDWWRVGSAAAGAIDEKKGGTNTNGEDARVVKSGANLYHLEKTDLELLAGDTARRARMLDDTLPWRPADFDATGIRLEALENMQADLGGADTMTVGDGVAPAVGGSVNLLVEVLILTEMDVPFTSTIPMVNYTNVFLLLASLFVQPEVLLTKLIRFYRSVRAWEAEVEDTSRAVYLERRILQCILVYCRVHETDLTLSCLQRLAVFAASEGFFGPAGVLDDAVGKEQWPCQEGVYCASRRRAALYARTMTNAATVATAGGASPMSTTGSGSGGFGSLRQCKRHGFMDARRTAELGIAGLFPQRVSPFDPNALLNPATRAPLENEVAQTLLEFTVYLQRTIVLYYRPIEILADSQKLLPFSVEGPPRMFVDTLMPRPSLGCASSTSLLQTAMTADPHLTPEPFAPAVGAGSPSLSGRFSERIGSPTGQLRVSRRSREHRYRGAGLPSNRGASLDSIEAHPNFGLDGREIVYSRGGEWVHGTARSAAGVTASPEASTLETTVLRKPLLVVDIDSEHLSWQICLLSFSLFASVHIRELLNNAWADISMKISVSTKLTELMEFSSHLQRWTAAVIVTPTTWAECQRGLRYFLEVCRMLYELQNYEMASAILEGLRHPSVEFLERGFVEVRGQGLLSSVERRELATLQELMDPFASYSPSSLYSVTARTVGDMETPMIPLLSPILGVIFRSEDVKDSTVSIRSSDGQAIVNWSKVISLGKMVVLWMRCQYTPFTFPVDPEIQEFLWSTKKHQWTDALLMRAARRAKQ